MSASASPRHVQFLAPRDVGYIHSQLLLEGQLKGLKSDEGLQSAVGRVEAAAIYDSEADLAKLAAYYWHGITVSHAFHDGNKRAGFVSMLVFLNMNGWDFIAPDAVMGPVIYGLFEVEKFTLEVLVHVIRRNIIPLRVDLE